jgi:hypothetical protein
LREGEQVQRVSTTVIALVGANVRASAEVLNAAANVRAVLPDQGTPPLDRAIEAWREAKSAHIPYLVHDADPLATVAEAWVRRFDQEGPVGELEVAVMETVARWRARSLELPDYYLVLDAQILDATSRHWYLGVLHRAAPSRVVPVASTPTDVITRIAHLPAGRWWPDLDQLLSGIDQVVPDQI